MATPRERVVKIEREVGGVSAQYGITDWEKTFLASIKERYGILTPKQEQALTRIEEKVFGDESDDDREEDEGRLQSTDDRFHRGQR